MTFYTINDPVRISDVVEITGTTTIENNLNITGGGLNITGSNSIISIDTDSANLLQMKNDSNVKFQIFNNKFIESGDVTYIGVNGNLTNHMQLRPTGLSLGASVTSTFLGPVGLYDPVTVSDTMTLTQSGDVLKVTNGNTILNNLKVTGTSNLVGNVGIGSLAPSNTLTIENNNSTYTDPEDNNIPSILIKNTNNITNTAHSMLAIKTTANNGGNPFISFDIAGVNGWSMGIDNQDSEKLKIANSWYDITSNTRLTITTNGNVGIGTTDPKGSFHNFSETASFFGSYQAGTFSIDPVTSFGTILAVNRDASGNFIADGRSSTIDMNKDRITFQGTTNTGTAGNAISYTEHMRIQNSSGYVGIGTNSPLNILHIKKGTANEIFNLNIDLGGGLSTTYYPIAILDSGSGGIILKGLLVGHTEGQGRSILNLGFYLRGTFEVMGQVLGSIGTQDIVVYNNGGTYTIYLKATDYCQCNLDIKNTRGTILWNGTGSTTTPSGSLVFSISSGTGTGSVLYQLSSGNIGIGTNNPGLPLEVKNSSSIQALFTSSNGSGSIRLQNSGAHSYEVQCEGPNLDRFIVYDRTNLAYRFVITSAGNVGLGGLTGPSYQLQLSSDSAAKPTSSTWTISSDQRVKENIVDANLDTCYNDVKNIQLKYFKWTDLYINEYNVEDVHNLGFIAQQVETINPKAVKTKNNEELSIADFKSVDKDQLLMSLFGAVKKLQEKVELLETYH